MGVNINPFICIVLIAMSCLSLIGEVKVAVIQYAIQEPDSVGIDGERLAGFIREAASQGAELIVAPETAFYRYSPWEQNGVTMLDLANEFEGLSSSFSRLAKELGVMVVIGLREPSGDPLQPVYNTGLFFGPYGEILGRHRKLNPSNAEKKWTKAGNSKHGDARPFSTPIGRVGMLICKDMDNSVGCSKCPAWDLSIAEHEMDLFLGISGDNTRGWKKVVRGAQVANCFGIGANLAQSTWDEAIRGNSGFVNQLGEVIGEAGAGEKIIYKILPLKMKRPLPGQLIPDPYNKSFVVYNRDHDRDGNLDAYFLCGPGDPEGFLYQGARNADGTRVGALQLEQIRKLAKDGGNSIYFIAVRTHGGDAWKNAREDPETYPDEKHNPWYEQKPESGLNGALLDQWDEWFRLMDESGITIYFFIYDDAIKVSQRFGWSLDSDGNLHPDEKYFIESLVNRFEHHRNLIWCVMEEGQEIGDSWRQHISKIAETIHEADDHGHIIASHQLAGKVFFHSSDPYISQFALQTDKNLESLENLGSWMANAWEMANGRYSLVMSEDYVQGNRAVVDGDRDEVRKRNWVAAMHGAYSMVLGMDITTTPSSWLNDCRTLQSFFESTTFNTMTPAKHIVLEDGMYALARESFDYLLYSPNPSENFGVANMKKGTYSLVWLNCATGDREVFVKVFITAGKTIFNVPSGFEDDVALYIHREDKRPSFTLAHTHRMMDEENVLNRSPIVENTRSLIKQGETQYIQLWFDDPDGGPGPYQVTIVEQPVHGKLSGIGNDRYYTPDGTFTGEDSFSWKVSDGKDESEIARIRIVVK